MPSTSTASLPSRATLGPLTADQRRAIMLLAPSLCADDAGSFAGCSPGPAARPHPELIQRAGGQARAHAKACPSPVLARVTAHGLCAAQAAHC